MQNIVSLEQAVHLLKQGEVLAYPTEAVWGLGCDPYNENAFTKILQLKQRPIEKGVILLASDIQQVDFLFQSLPKSRYQEIIQSWSVATHQQATTWLFPITTHIPQWIVGQHSKVAVRVTQHPLSQALCQSFANFIVSTSANPSGLSPATTLTQAQHYFKDDVFYVDGRLGQQSKPSRIIDAETGIILRD